MRRADDALRVALVTGACSGIGLAFARKLASLGYELVIVSQRPTELAAVARELASNHGVKVHPIVMDLARAEAATELHAATGALGLSVDILINNAGMLLQGPIVEADPARAAALLLLHVVTPSLLATLYGAELRARRRGHVLFVSSISAWRDLPTIGYYGTSKKYVRAFANVLRDELRHHGVGVTTVAPGATATGFYDDKLRALGEKTGVMVEPEFVVDAALEAMWRGDAEVVPGVGAKLMAAAMSATPGPLLRLANRLKGG